MILSPLSNCVPVDTTNLAWCESVPLYDQFVTFVLRMHAAGPCLAQLNSALLHWCGCVDIGKAVGVGGGATGRFPLNPLQPDVKETSSKPMSPV